jgi:hypothetical protein
MCTITAPKRYTHSARDNAKNVANLKGGASFWLQGDGPKDGPHVRDNWICYDFHSKRAIPATIQFILISSAAITT